MKKLRPTLEMLVNDAAVVYSMPLVCERLNRAINNPRASISDITQVIAEDQGLSARILRMANSPVFGYHKGIDTITRAVMIIGTQQLHDLTLAVSVMKAFRSIPEELMNMNSFWEHSITCGIVARNLALCRREANVERFFVAGILHDVGQLILCTRAPEVVGEMIERSRRSGEPQFILQWRELGFDHGVVGGELLKRWQIPPVIFEPVACHHSPCRAKLHPREAAIIHVADVIVHGLQIGFAGESYVPPLDEQAWELVGIHPAILSSILKRTDEELHETLDAIAQVMNDEQKDETSPP